MQKKKNLPYTNFFKDELLPLKMLWDLETFCFLGYVALFSPYADLHSLLVVAFTFPKTLEAILFCQNEELTFHP